MNRAQWELNAMGGMRELERRVADRRREARAACVADARREERRAADRQRADNARCAEWERRFHGARV